MQWAWRSSPSSKGDGIRNRNQRFRLNLQIIITFQEYHDQASFYMLLVKGMFFQKVGKRNRRIRPGHYWQSRFFPARSFADRWTQNDNLFVAIWGHTLRILAGHLLALQKLSAQFGQAILLIFTFWCTRQCFFQSASFIQQTRQGFFEIACSRFITQYLE